ncbi:MAG: acyloxyacyl hydrolase [Sphingobacteriaceae bacterium]|jgi:hypothetical protein
MIRNTLIALLILFQSFLSSQNGLITEPNWQIKPYFNYAAIIQHRSTLGNLIKGYPKTYELNIVKPTRGNCLWQLENNKPDLGLNLSLIDYANPKELGYGFIVAPFAEIPLSKKEKASRLFLRLCWGTAFMTKHFDVVENQKNIAIGSTVNAYVQFKWFWHIKINDNLRFEPGFMFSHISNGRSQSPNLGLNVFGVGAALNFNLINKVTDCSKIDSSTCVKSKNEIIIINSYGFNDGEIMGKKLLTSCLSIGYNFNRRNTHKFGLGFDVFYEKNYVKDVKNAGFTDPTLIDQLRYGPKFSYSYNIGRISLPIEMGVYLKQVTNPDGLFFHRLGVRYIGDKGLMVTFGLRTHWAVAYCFDYGIGYRINL